MRFFISLWFLLVIFPGITFAEERGVKVRMEIEKDQSLDKSKDYLELTVYIKNMTDEPVCVLRKDVPGFRHIPENLNFSGEIDLIVEEEGLRSAHPPALRNIIIFPGLEAFFYTELMDFVDGLVGEFEVHYRVNVYDCSELASLDSYYGYLALDSIALETSAKQE